MSASDLRKAAETLRERANAATPGPWAMGTTGIECGDHWHVLAFESMQAVCHIRSDDGDNEDQRPRDAGYIATMHPGVGLALADLLDQIAKDREDDPYMGKVFDAASLEVARLINGGQS
jgi:hypothetical protein